MQHLVEIGEGQVILSDSLYETHLINKKEYLSKQIQLCINEVLSWDTSELNNLVVNGHFDVLESLIKEHRHTFADLIAYWRSREHNGES